MQILFKLKTSGKIPIKSVIFFCLNKFAVLALFDFQNPKIKKLRCTDFNRNLLKLKRH